MTAKLLSDPHARNVAVQVRVLRLIQAGPLDGKTLIAGINAFDARAQERLPEYGFVGWLGTTIFGLLRSVVEQCRATMSGPLSPSDSEIYGCMIYPTDRTGALEAAAFEEWGDDFRELIALLE